VLWKYHGRPGFSRLERVLDAALPRTDEHAMWPYLGEEGEIAPRREAITSWIREGAPESGWPALEGIFRGDTTCGQCHVPGGKKEDLPFETYEQVLPLTRPDEGMAAAPLLVSAHNHLFAFSVLALILSVAVGFSPALGRARALLVLGAFLGCGLDIASWFLTKAIGSPFHFGVILGGALFGLATTGMGLLVLDEVAWRGKVASRFASRKAQAGAA
jgi:hypothetical protein